jgi:hypothetical protein
VTGTVQWTGPLPKTPTILAPRKPNEWMDLSPLVEWANPHAPQVDPATSGICEAVVFLRGVDVTRARPWDLPPVCVEIADAQMSVAQGEHRKKMGFVRRGDAVEFVSRESSLHLIRARGASFFCQPLSQPGTVRSRTLEQAGHIELASGAGYFWMRCHLFVSEHPYFATTDAQGQFTLSQVPAGEYELVAWLPNWHEIDHDRSGDTGFRTATRYAEPLIHTQRIAVRAGEATTVKPFSFADR